MTQTHEQRNSDDFVLINNSDIEGSKVLGVKPGVVLKLKKWLEPTDYDSDVSEYKKHLNAHVQGTAQWVLETEQYQKWHGTDHIGDIWIRSVPGGGKSVVAANLIRKLKEEEDVPVLFFFFRQIILSNRSPMAFLRDACTQLLDRSPLLQTDLEGLMKKYPSITELPMDELFKAFSAAMVNTSKVFCILDAMDEMQLGEDTFLENLLNLGRRYPKSIKLALTSRQLPYLEAHFKGSCLVDLRLDQINVDKDISVYITHRLEQVQARIAVKHAEHIKATICGKGKGLFLYARLMMDECIRDPNRFLSSELPNGLGDMYSDLLEEHATRSGTTQKFQQLVLEFVTHSQRPLRLTEITAVVNSLPNRGGLTELQDTKKSIRSCCGPLLEICEDEVVQIIHHSFTEYLTGSTVSHVQMGDREKRRFPVLISSSIHATIAIACIDYLQSGCFVDSSIEDRCEGTEFLNRENYHGSCFDETIYDGSDELQILSLNFSFLSYAIRFWTVHASLVVDKNAALVQALDGFLIHNNHDFECWKDFWPEFLTHRPKYLTPLHIAAFSGLRFYVNILLNRGVDAMIHDAFQRTPLMYASMRGHDGVVSDLAHNNAKIDDSDRLGYTAAHHAAKNGHANVFRVLLAAGADPLLGKRNDDPLLPGEHPSLDDNRFDDARRGNTALYYICRRGHTQALKVYLEFVDPEQLPHEALFWAVRGGMSAIVEVLLQNPWNVNQRDNRNNTALFYAALDKNPKTVKALLLAGADPNLTSESYFETRPTYRRHKQILSRPRISKKYVTPLHGLTGTTDSQILRSSLDHEKDVIEILTLLYNAGCEINARTHQGHTALFGWNQWGWTREDFSETFVAWLLNHGADASILDNNGASVLHQMEGWAMSERNVVKLLIGAGANINTQKLSDGQTPLIQAARVRQLIDPSLFHEFGADFDIQDDEGNTALHHICASWTLEATHIDHWLSFADPTIPNNAGRLALTNFQWGNGGEGRVSGIKKMVKKGVDLETRDYLGRTLMLTFLDNDSRHGNEIFVRELLRLGADATAVDYQGKSALHLLVTCDLSWIGGDHDSKKKRDLMMDFIDAGCNPNATDYLGNTLFHDLISWDKTWDKAFVATAPVLEFCCNIRASNFQGQTALHQAAALIDDGYSDASRAVGGNRLRYILRPEMGFDINARDQKGMTPIHLAAMVSEINVWTLLKAGSDVAIKDKFGNNALHFAARAGKCVVVDILIQEFKQRAISIDQQNFKGRRPIHEAARSGKLESVVSLLEAGASPILLDRRQRSPLHAAAEFEHATVARAAQKKYDNAKIFNKKELQGLDMAEESETRGGFTGLGVISNNEDYATQIREVVKCLLEAGAVPSALDMMRHTPSDVALMVGNHAVVQELHSSMHNLYQEQSVEYKPLDPVGEALASASHLNIKQMIDAVEVDRNNTLLLERIFSYGDEALVDYVLDRKIPLIHADGSSPIHYAVRWGMVSLVKKLLPHVPNINSIDPPLLHTASERATNNLKMFELLIASGADVKALHTRQETQNSNGYVSSQPEAKFSTILHHLSTGALHWSPRALQLALDCGADPETENHEGKTALQIAISSQDTSQNKRLWGEQVLDVLLKYGVNVNSVSSKGFTPLNIALSSAKGHETAHKLVAYGADGSLGPLPAIASAIENQDTDSLEMFLNSGADPNVEYVLMDAERYRAGESTRTPLLSAATSFFLHIRHDKLGSKSLNTDPPSYMIDLLVKHGAKPMQLMRNGTTSVIHSIAKVNGRLTSSLLQNIDLEARDSQGRTLLHCACDLPTNYKRVLKEEHAALVLLEHGASVDARDDEGNTPLHYAVAANLRKTIRALLDKGASPMIKNNAGNSALQNVFTKISLYSPNIKRWALESLLDFGADPLECNPTGQTALHHIASELAYWSATCGRNQELSYSEDGEGEEEGREKDLAEFVAFKALYQRFLTAGCDPERADLAGNTPIFNYVARVKYYDDCEFGYSPNLDDHQAMFSTHEITKVNHDGDGLLHVVAKREDTREEPRDGLVLWKLLTELGLDPRRENKKGVTALDVAAACGSKLILELYARKD